MKRFNLGFKYFGFPEQCDGGKYILYEEYKNLQEGYDEVIKSKSIKLWEFTYVKLPSFKLHYSWRIEVLFFLNLVLALGVLYEHFK